MGTLPPITPLSSIPGTTGIIIVVTVPLFLILTQYFLLTREYGGEGN
jgi:hypothetical protein